MKNLRNILKKFTAVTLLAAILFTGSVVTSNSGNPDDGIMPLGSTIYDYLEF